MEDRNELAEGPDDDDTPAPVAVVNEGTSRNLESDDSWESKYGKLKEYALKLKRVALDKSQKIEVLEAENAKISGKSQNLSTIQQQFDKALDEVEKFKSLEASLQKDLNASIKDNIRLKEANFEFQAQIKNYAESSKTSKEKLETLEANELELKKLKARVIELEAELKDVKGEHLDVKQEKRQRAILSLEITDYEKKLAGSSEKILEQQRQLEIQNQLLLDNEKLITSLELKLKENETTISDLNGRQELLQADITQKAEKNLFLQGEVSKLNEKLTEKKSEISKLSREFESAKLNFSSESNTLVERCDRLMHSVTQHEHKISVLEEHKRSRESHISNLKLELMQLDSHFNNYKLKAHSMLKTQKPSGNHSTESDELENLQKIVQDFHSEIAVLKSDMRTIKLENETLCLERAELGLKLTQTKTANVEREVAHDKEVQRLKESMKQKEKECQNALENIKIENSALVTSYTVQLESLKSGYEMKVRHLDEEVRSLKSLNDSLEVISQDRGLDIRPEECEVFQAQNEHIPPILPLTIDTSSGGIALEQLQMIPRGECEGSENNMSPQTYLQTPSTHLDISFEQLLSTDMENLFREKYIDNYSQHTSTYQQSLKAELIRCRQQIKHLQNILKESESNCERLTQLNEALKQEIRRVERDSERKEHLKENTEYLKNVVLKFMALNGEDEKLRLIPVIRTMLRLTPTEAEKLEIAVKGGATGGLSHSTRDEQTGGWSSYVPLPKWSFGGNTK